MYQFRDVYLYSAAFECVNTGAFFDLLVVAATDRRNCLCVMTSSLDGA
jgi:hypothetical protein